MAASSARIDELRKKFDENPRRYFAPLANEYRKAGDLEQAIFICQEYLPQQPGHMSGHIVYGQALFELGRFDEARTVFETALSLDPENLIALRHLGDIARQGGDLDAARGWYQRVLEADPRNEEITQIMLALLGADVGTDVGADSGAVSQPAPGVESPEASAMATSPGGATDVDQAAATPLANPTVPPPVPDTALLDVEKSTEVVMDSRAEGETAEPPPPPPVQQPDSFRSRHAPDEEDLLDLNAFDVGGVPLGSMASSGALTDVDVGMASPPEPPVEMAADLDIGLSDDGTASTTRAGHDVPVEGLETFEAGIAAAADAPASILDTESFFDLPATAEPATSESSSSAANPGGASGGGDEPAGAEPQAAFVTETMAELYLRQGHVESALDIYRRLVDMRPDDAALQARLVAVEQRVSGTSAAAGPASSAATFSPESVTSATPSSYGGPTIREFLTDLVMGRRAPAATAALDFSDGASTSVPVVTSSVPVPAEETTNSGPGAVVDAVESLDVALTVVPPTPGPTHTVSDSLDVFFGGADAAEPDGQAANTLAEAFAPESPETTPLEGVPAHRASNELSLDHVFKGGGPPPSDADGFSFDQFFSAEGAENSEPESDAAPGMSPESTDDIAQFNAWLNGLKKT